MAPPVTPVETGPPLYASAPRAVLRAIPAPSRGGDGREAAILAAAALFLLVAASGSVLRNTLRMRLR
ncbi:MAG: hypothetical protein ACJ76V_16040 [Thermoleophilaceae bacterium]